MTELQALLTFLLSISHRYQVKQDCDRIQNVLNHVYLNKDSTSFERFLVSLMALDDAIVSGLNTGRFEWKEHGAFSLYPQSCLPKFLRGVLSKVFDDEGNLRDNYSEFDLATIEGLRLVRRTQFPSMDSKAEKRAVQKFIDFQREVRFTNPTVLEQMKEMWELFAPEHFFRRDLQLGFPGPGAMHDIEYPHVPQLCFVDHNTIPDPLVAGIMSDALALRLQTFAFDHEYPACPYITIYPFKKGPRVSTLVAVPKTCLIKRAITVTDPDAVIIGATLRVSLFNLVNTWHWKKVLNVHDQSISHRTLINDFNTTNYLDLEGGTSCLKLETMDKILPDYASRMLACSKSDFFAVPNDDPLKAGFTMSSKKALSKELRQIYDKIDLIDHSRNGIYEDPDLPIEGLESLHGLEKVTTLAQGDASSVALLTITLGLVLALAVYLDDFVSRELDAFTFSDIARFIEQDGRFHVVGDDMIYPSRYENSVRYVLRGLGVTVNERKSSGMTGRHKETCGAWAIKLPDGTIRSIFPFRHPDKQALAVTRMQATQEFIKRSLKSVYSVDLAIAVTSSLPFTFLEEYESYDLSRVGSPYGVKPPRFKYHTFTDSPAELADAIAYAFGIDPTRFFPKESSSTAQLAVGYRPERDSPHLPFISHSKATRIFRSGFRDKKRKSSKVSDKERRNSYPRHDTVEFLLSFLKVNNLITLFS